MESLINNNYATEINDYGTMLTVEKLPLRPGDEHASYCSNQ